MITKSKRKNSKNTNSSAAVSNPSNGSEGKLLGIDIKSIGIAVGTAVATTLLEEFAQAVIRKTSRSVGNGDPSVETHDPVGESASSVKAVLEDSNPSLNEAVNLLKDVINEIKPTVAGTVEKAVNQSAVASSSVRKMVGQTIDQTIDQAGALQDTARYGVSDTVNAVRRRSTEAIAPLQNATKNATKNVAYAVKDVFQDDKTTKKGKKNKNKKNKKKSGKKKG